MKPQDIIDAVKAYAVAALDAALELLLRPRRFFRNRKAHFEHDEGHALSDTLVLTLVFIAVGLCVANFFKISDDKSIIDLADYLAAIVIWVMFGFFCHLLLKVIRGRAPLKLSIIVALLTISIVHVIWVPVFGVLSINSANTRVTVTYDYLISFGYGNWKDIYLSPLFSPQGKDYEIYILEQEPEKHDTLLRPAADEAGVRSEQEWTQKNPNQPFFSSSRVPANDIDPSLYSVRESEILDPNSVFAHLSSYLMLAYFFTLYFYLSIGLSVAHERSVFIVFPYLIFSLILLSFGALALLFFA